MGQPVVFLDRDGTINVDHGYVHRIEDWQFVDRAIEAIRRFRQHGFAVAVVTNQSGIALGYYTREQVDALHAHMQHELARQETAVDAIAYCPHRASDDCDCRKPRTGMSRLIAQQLGRPIQYAASWTVGDKPADVQFGIALGTRTALLTSRYWTAAELSCQPDLVADSLDDVAQQICRPPRAGRR